MKQEKKWRTFEEARNFVRGLVLKSQKEWQAFSKTKHRPKDIPSCPDQIYKDCGWNGWGHWLGTGKASFKNMAWRPFEEARKFVHGLNIKNRKEWYEFSGGGGRPEDIPAAPWHVYKDSGWRSIADWVGGEKKQSHWLPFEEAREFARNLNIKSRKEWSKRSRPDNIPSNPNRDYKDSGWISYGDWLGTGNVHKGDWRPFEEAREFARSLGINDCRSWREFAKGEGKPKDIPANPSQVYKGFGWAGWPDWLRKQS
jgi:hypothetical protein